MANKDVSPESYLKFRDFLEKQCGIVLGDNKQYLVRSRLASLLYKHKYESADELIDVVVRGFDRTLLQGVIDAMTTNETLWFRDNYPFDLLIKDLLPKLASKNQKIRIWSAACSSGQEPYSIAMSVLEFQRQRPGALRAGVEIVATDLSSEMLKKCEQGIYDELSLARGLSAQRRDTFFEQHETGLMQVKPEVRRMVSFRSLNLLSSYAGLGRFDIVFCRNVLIYFSPQVKQRILQQIAGQLQSDGVLFLGASESISAASDIYSMVKCHPGLYYQKK
ncbi:protein-glutamate O-methyltransferase CheR [Alteromonas sp. McT4-15]|uniref:CheR family methyltransferase n=1 Tax=unclassified Alteromonas TaxID=2614992 RepID=UPI0012E406EE|nr:MULTISPECIES: protein-glutamate O-methyltransferase CheR [unclassified Alteromonas]GFD88138.1 chemotaxis protein CheR [Tenacibaculum sp. KUL152]MCB4435368.1 protein-glutamate O-methyltransferase CheR [Alteromonas sp. McT4-15]WDT87119.1 protein-glutamate O-methyltransferase CheR [Alteromonas sp. 009811495]BCO18119.1 chemotaxis protein CheR [Alteromonas sp. KC3]BCO22080.1 chemotaxis protein CheR [Alteromonas sp. KC14]